MFKKQRTKAVWCKKMSMREPSSETILNENDAHQSVAVIGCGPSGMAVLSAFSFAQQKGDKIPEVICFEQQASMGGQWNYTWRTGIDEYGVSVSYSMYRGMIVNNPKEIQELFDYTYDEHFKKPIPSYVSRECFKDYLLGRTKKYDIERFVLLRTVVRNVKSFKGKFLVHYERVGNGKVFEKIFNHVAVATGHFSTPNFPTYLGIKSFPGRVLHSHDFRKPEEFTNQTLLIVGAKWSAEDIALQHIKYGGTRVYISHRTTPLNQKWPDNIIEVPQLVNVTGRTCHFKDGSSCNVDTIIFATGYLHHFPFMEEGLRLSATPSTEDRLKDIKKWRVRLGNLQNKEEELYFQLAYIKDLVEGTDYPAHKMDHMVPIALAKGKDRRDNILNYRDQQYTSGFTGTTGVRHPKLWTDNKDSSLASYVSPDFLPCNL